MCQAIPRKVLEIGEDHAIVLYDGEPRRVVVHDIPDLAVGEYLIVYAEQALQRMDTEDAEELLSFLDGLDRMLEEASNG